MVRRFLTFLVALAFIGAVRAQAPGTPNEGSVLTRDATSGTYTFSWWGQTARTYFIQHSEDLMTWEYIPVIEPGAGQVAEWGFSSTGEKFFLRLKYTDVATTDPFADDFDGDHVSNYDELQGGTDPFHFADTDSDGLSDDWEIKYFGNLASSPTGDADDDELTNLQEYLYYSDPMDYGNRGGSTMFGDSDLNGLADWWEILYFGHLGNDPNQLVPAKGLTLQQIFDNDLDLTASSTTRDDIPDSWKIANGLSTSNSNVANEDADGDGLTNGEEYAAGTDPQAWDGDGDGTADGYDLHPLVADPSAPQSLQVAVPSWEEQNETEEPDWSLVDWTTVEVRWEAATFNPTGYRIERRQDSDIWQEIATVGAGTTTQSDENLVANRHYQYRVFALKNANGQQIESLAAVTDYEVPLNLRISVKRSSLGRWKDGFSEFTNPSTPPKYYLVLTETSSMNSSNSGSDWSSNSNGQFSFTQTVAPSEHSRSYEGSYSDSYSYSGNNSSSSDSETSTYQWFDQDRGKQNLTSTSQGSKTAESSSSSHSGSSSSSSSWDMAGDYLMQGTYQANNGQPKWMGDDFDLGNGTIIWNGNSSYSTHSSNSSGSSSSTTANSSAGADGSWLGTSTSTSSGGGGSSYTLYGPAWSGGWYYSGWWSGFQGETATTRTYQYSSTSGNYSYSSSGTDVLSQEYATAAFMTDVINDLPDYPDEWDEDWYGWGYYNWGYWGWDYWGYWGSWYPWGSPWYGWWVADRHLNSTEDHFSISKMTYKFKASPSASKTMRWYEVFVPEDDPATAEVDESTQIDILRERTWVLGANENESPEYEIDPSGDERNGYYTILIEPVHVGVSGIGEAGKDVAGQDTAPGKVVLINDRDADSDGIPDYADGFDRDGQREDDDTSYGAAFTPVGIGFYASDPENSKIKFTYDASNPSAMTSSPTDPYVLPATGKIRLWLVDAEGSWDYETGEHVPRNPDSAKQGGDYIAPGVEYTFEELGITSSTYLTVYVEAVKVSGAVADIPIKVEVDPTGSLGYQWSDQLRFTATKVSLFAYGYPDPTSLIPNPIHVNHVVASSVYRVKGWYDDYGFTPNSYLRYRAQVSDPRNNLQTFTLNGVAVPMSKAGAPHYETEPFICVRSGETTDENAPGLWFVPLSNEEAYWRYNAEGRYGNGGRMGKVVADINELAEHVEDASDRLWATFAGNPSEWGQAVETEVSNLVQNDKRWVHNVRVTTDPDAGGNRRIVSINRVLVPPEINGTTEIDFVRLKRGQRLREGDIWAMSKVENIYELKTSLTGRLDVDQRDRLIAIAGDPKKLITSGPGKYSFIDGALSPNPRWKAAGYMYKALNGGAQVAFVVLAMVQMSEAADDFTIAAQKYKDAGDNGFLQMQARTEMEAAMQTIVTCADPIGIVAAVIKKTMDDKFIKDLCEIMDH